VHHAVVVCEQEHCGTQVFADRRGVGQRIWEDCPDEGYHSAGSDCGQPIRADFVDSVSCQLSLAWSVLGNSRIERLTAGRGGFDADFQDLQLVADDEDLGHHAHQPDGEICRELEEKVHLDEEEEPEHDDDAGCLSVDNVPDSEGQDH